MPKFILNGADLESMLRGAWRKLSLDAEKIDALNVFPVPDGDTGTNMSKTLEGAVLTPSDDNAGAYMKSFSKKTLLCARGNSGVILSQFIRGFAKGCDQKTELDLCGFSEAFVFGVKYAYSAVIKPVEGTMLTVLRDGGNFLSNNFQNCEDFEGLIEGLLSAIDVSLAATPSLLPALKEAGVIDSGGAGIKCIIEGMLFALTGKISDYNANHSHTEAFRPSSFEAGPDFVFEYGYCTEFILQLLNAKCPVSQFDISELSDYLSTIGDSIVAVNDGDIVKIHIHTHTPEKAIAKAREYGELLTVKIENMSLQHSEITKSTPAPKLSSAPKAKYAVVAVAAGEGLKKYFSEIGVSALVDGGQTANPSTEDFLAAFRTLDAEHIIVLPSNSNVVLAAQQAAKIYKDTDVRVIPTKSYAECYSALSMMDLTQDSVEGLIESMTSYLPYVTSGYVTVATRDAVINGVNVRKGEYIGLDDDNILSCENEKTECAIKLFKNLPDIDDKGVITVFYGKDVTKEELAALQDKMDEELSDIDTAFIFGGQDVYSFIFSIE